MASNKSLNFAIMYENSNKQVMNTDNAQNVHIVLASDENYRPGLEVTQNSIIANCKTPERLHFHIFGEKELAQIDTSGFSRWNSSMMPYFRLFLPNLMPDTDYVIYSDVDTIWQCDICELWNERDDHAIAWVRDFDSSYREGKDWFDKINAAFDAERYACSGVCLMNLRKMREQNMTENVLEIFRTHGIPLHPDQDVLNLLYNQDSKMLSSKWDCMGQWRDLPRPETRCVYHITGIGRHFHDAQPPRYPPQYQLWWNERHHEHTIAPRSKLLARLWPLHRIAIALLRGNLRERIIRQWFFARRLLAFAAEN